MAESIDALTENQRPRSTARSALATTRAIRPPRELALNKGKPWFRRRDQVLTETAMVLSIIHALADWASYDSRLREVLGRRYSMRPCPLVPEQSTERHPARGLAWFG